MKSIASFRIAALACCVPFTLAHADLPEYVQTELQARSTAHGAILQLMIDAHRIWSLGDE